MATRKSTTTTTNKTDKAASKAAIKLLILAVVDACRESAAASQLAGSCLQAATKATQEALDAVLSGVVADPRKPDPTQAQDCWRALDAALVAAGLPDSTACRRTERQAEAPDEARAAARIAVALSQRLSRSRKAAIKGVTEQSRRAVRSGHASPELAERVALRQLDGLNLSLDDKAALHDACRAGVDLQASPIAVTPQVTPGIASNLLARCQEIADSLSPRLALTEIMRLLENALSPTTNLPASETLAEKKIRSRVKRNAAKAKPKIE